MVYTATGAGVQHLGDQTPNLSPIVSKVPRLLTTHANNKKMNDVLSTHKVATDDTGEPRTRAAWEGTDSNKTDRYDGKGPWDSYIKHFELCASINGWDDVTKCQYLAVLLTSPAQQILGTLQSEANDYHRLVTSLQARFDPTGRKELHRAQLRNRRQKLSESLVVMSWLKIYGILWIKFIMTCRWTVGIGWAVTISWMPCRTEKIRK